MPHRSRGRRQLEDHAHLAGAAVGRGAVEIALRILDQGGMGEITGGFGAAALKLNSTLSAVMANA